MASIWVRVGDLEREMSSFLFGSLAGGGDGFGETPLRLVGLDGIVERRAGEMWEAEKCK